MDRIRELLARLEELAPEELEELFGLLNEELETLAAAEPSVEANAALVEVGEGLTAVRAENDRREAAAAEVVAERDRLLAEARNAVDPAAETTEEQPEETPAEPTESAVPEGDEPTPEAAAPAEVETPEAEERVPEPVAAAAPPAPARLPSLGRANLRRPASLAPRQRHTDDGIVITAAGDVPGISAGGRFPDLAAVGRAFAEKAAAMARGGRGAANVATFHGEAAGEVLTASGGDAQRNAAIVASALAAHRAEVAALVAAGGFCAPAAPLYNFQQISVADRPIRNALTRVPSERGRVSWIPPARLADADAGITVHTLAQDESATTKPCVTIDCGTEDTANVDAIPLCVTVGNFDRITFPEHFANFFEVALAEHARVAERNLLDTIDGNKTGTVTDGSLMGAAREVLSTLGRVAAVQRNAFRMPRNAPVEVIAPLWLLAAMREDLTRQHPGDSAIATADAEIQRYFQADNLMVTFAYEGRTGAGQDFAEQGTGALQGYPAQVEFQVFHPDAHFLLELPELNLGTEIRDSTLNAANNVQAWLETFEGTGFNGLWSLRLTLDVCFDGDSNAGNAYDCTDVATGS